MSNVLDNDKQQQILALGRLGWSLRRIEQALAVRRETVSGYLKAAGIAVHAAPRLREDRPRTTSKGIRAKTAGAVAAVERAQKRKRS